MNKFNRLFRHLILSAIAGFLTISLATFAHPAQSLQPSPLGLQISSAALHEAEQVLVAQGMEDKPITRYVAVMTQNAVIPAASSSYAFGAAGAVLMGDRLIVRGNFSNLSSQLRDYATDPLNPPNPKVTSAVHIHKGEPTANGPFQYALEVSPGDAGLQGRFMGEYTLTSEQLQALASGKLYMDIHTQQNRTGEMRGVLKPY